MSSKGTDSFALTDSPWFWVLLFSLAGLVALVVVGPKFERRELALETKFHGRQRAMERESVDPAADETTPPATEWQPIFTLAPIAAAIGIVALVASIALIRLYCRRSDHRPMTNNQ